MTWQGEEKKSMRTSSAYQNLTERKIQAFERLQPEFERCFRFIQEVHGQRRFQTFSVRDIVYYLHALWVCERKDRLLSVYRNIVRYEGQRCLSLLHRWQAGQDDEVIAFLQYKLDGLPFTELAGQIQAGRITQREENGTMRRLMHGRQVLLNRGINLMLAIEALFALPEAEIVQEVQAACLSLGHHPTEIEQQLAELEDPLYSYAPHRSLAQRNMLVMNTLGMAVMTLSTDKPGDRSWKVLAPTEKPYPFAEHRILGYLELLSPWYNNLQRHRFFDPPERGQVFSL